MSWEGWAALAVVVVVFGMLARGRVAPDAALLGGVVFLCALGPFSDRFPDAATVARGFGNEALLTVAALYVVSAAMVRTGAIDGLTRRVLGQPRSPLGAQLRLTFPVALLSAFMNNTPVVAMTLPAVKEWAKRARLDPARLLMPLSYAAVLGGVCTLIGTSTTLVVQGLLRQAGERTFDLFTISPIGVPVAVAGLLYTAWATHALLPARAAPEERIDDPRTYRVGMRVLPGSPLVGATIEEAGLRGLAGLFLAEIERGEELHVAVGPDEQLRADDRLMFVGEVRSVVELGRIPGLAPLDADARAGSRERAFVEAVVGRTSPVSGRSIREAKLRSRYDAVVVGVHRDGDALEGKLGDVVLQPGDALLLETDPRFVDRWRGRRDFLLVAPLGVEPVRRRERAGVAAAIALAFVGLAACEPLTGLSVGAVALIAASALVLTRCVTVTEARQSIDASTLLAIGSALALASTLESTGVAQVLSGAILAPASAFGPWGALAGIYLTTLILTELVTNNAAAALVFPIALATARQLDVDVFPFALAIAVAASAGFASPLGYQTHLMVYGPGGYRFGDFARVGLPLDLLVMAIAVTLIHWLFPF